ncbi:transporter substrate-binding domain-containing protein [Mesorhizobium sp. CO1-1-8]|uniref:transporter substrate-binding domain-containing protein n=1 Tax=Mesorhizobium sp. CO1-1-8 TaxID=2876631 RepID=UPI001CD0D9CA|nr:transporter substrate-binding domain-containing protein [Mesorhizobium sp. CO1-1-8]MBZ9772242.1 transporter substrate-binding domain-containing protein [Mesorhizobium sp. CO1-1-8]
MKIKLVALAFASVLAFGSGAMAEQVKVGMGAFPAPPFFAPDAAGKFTGWEPEILAAICADQQLDCTIMGVSWDGLIPALTSGQIDMIMSSMSITPKRQEVIDFSDKYYNSPIFVVGAKDAKFDATPEGLAGKTIGLQTATIQEAYAKKYFTHSTVKSYKSFDEVLQDLVAGRIDATMAESPYIEKFVEEAGAACCDVKGAVKPDVEIFGPGVGAGFRKGETALKDKVNQGIKNIRANGTYDKISTKYFKSSIYGD